MNFLLAAAILFAAESVPLSDGETWNEGVDFYRKGDVTNSIRVLRPLMLTKDFGARAAEVVAKLEYERGNREEAVNAAQIALRANPKDAKANRNFTRAANNLLEIRENQRISRILEAVNGKDPTALLKSATEDARRLFTDSGTYRTNQAARAVVLSDAYSARAEKLADAWIPVRQLIVSSVTNEQQAATILAQLDQGLADTEKAAKELSDLDGEAYASLSRAESAFTRFLKLTITPPAAMDEDLIAQSNAWQDVAAFNNRAWQNEALDYTRAFRARFPMWARAYEAEAQSDTNKPPFTAEAQAKISALATELEKLQLECCEKNLPPLQEQAIGIINEIRELLPKDGKGGGQGEGGSGTQPPQNDEKNQRQDEDRQSQENQSENPEEQEEEDRSESAAQENKEDAEDQSLEDLLKKAEERNNEHESDKKARMKAAPLPPNERDW